MMAVIMMAIINYNGDDAEADDDDNDCC